MREKRSIMAGKLSLGSVKKCQSSKKDQRIPSWVKIYDSKLYNTEAFFIYLLHRGIF